MDKAPIYNCIEKNSFSFALPKFLEVVSRDNGGRIHLRTPCSGQATLFVCLIKKNGTAVASHINDIYRMIMLDEQFNQKSILLIMPNVGPEFTPMFVRTKFIIFLQAIKTT